MFRWGLSRHLNWATLVVFIQRTWQLLFVARTDGMLSVGLPSCPAANPIQFFLWINVFRDIRELNWPLFLYFMVWIQSLLLIIIYLEAWLLTLIIRRLIVFHIGHTVAAALVLPLLFLKCLILIFVFLWEGYVLIEFVVHFGWLRLVVFLWGVTSSLFCNIFRIII